MKRILDTVHGYIMVKDEFVREIIDTRYFQRLRRIEQTSIRSVYPSARHDRFIHSLGVYHIGSLIVEHLKSEQKTNHGWGETDTTLQVIMESYLVACLLHDIAHAPFSHSFEEYYGKKRELENMLKKEIRVPQFAEDLVDAMKKDTPNYHELMSAYVAYKEYGIALKRLSIDAEFVARMITGVFYVQDRATHQVHNCFISLLHGRVIDADRLDYACRDVWASGYITSSVDLRRLISALHIKHNGSDYVVCFDSNALNEIEGVLNVKDFQVKYVINHHSVSYEQWLLRHAALHMAEVYFAAENEEDTSGEAALSRMINKDALIDYVCTRIGNLVIKNISDDDLIFMIKQDKDNPYYEEWASRKYTRYPLWKSPDEFYHFFKMIDRNRTLRCDDYDKRIIEYLNEKGLPTEDIVITTARFKPRVKIDSLYLVVANDLVRYTELYPDSVATNKEVEFYYVFIPKNSKDRSEIKDTVKEYLKALTPFMESLYTKEASGIEVGGEN